MSNRFEAEGNLGNQPELRSVTVDGQQRDVLDFSIYVDRRVRDGEGGFRDKGGFWLNGSLWGGRARPTLDAVKKGMRVRVAGELRMESWADRETGEERSGLKLDAEYLAIDPITYARKG